MSRSACSVRLAPPEMLAPGLMMMHTATKQMEKVKYTPPPSVVFLSPLMPSRLPLNGTGGSKPLPVFSDTVMGLVSKTRSIRASPLTSIRLAWVELLLSA